MDRVEAQRSFFARLITAKAGVAADSALCAAFASTPRERFVGAPPWKIFTRTGYIKAPADDPGLLYQDVVVSLGVEARSTTESHRCTHVVWQRCMCERARKSFMSVQVRDITQRFSPSWSEKKDVSTRTRLSRA